MNSNERELEKISDIANLEEVRKSAPVFEMFITLFSILMATMLFTYPQMLTDGKMVFSVHSWLLMVMPQYLWAFAFIISGFLKAIGLLLNSNKCRTLGLIISALIYSIFAICYSISFPNISSIVFSCISIFTFMSIPIVKHTNLVSKEEGV